MSRGKGKQYPFPEGVKPLPLHPDGLGCIDVTLPCGWVWEKDAVPQ